MLEPKVTDAEIKEFATPIMNTRLDALRKFFYRLQKAYNPYGLQRRAFEFFKEAEQRDHVKLIPLVRKLTSGSDVLTADVFLSGPGSTTQVALKEISRLYNETKAPFVRYRALISDDPRSGAMNLGTGFGLPHLVEDFLQFCTDNGWEFKKFSEAVGGTNPSQKELKHDERQRRLELRVAYDEYLDKRISEDFGNSADLDLLRGYRFMRGREGFDTHPAPLYYLDENGKPAYAGWHEGPIIKMIEDGFLREQWPFSSSMMLTRPIRTLDDLNELDAGFLVMSGQGIKVGREGSENRNEIPYELSRKLSKPEDRRELAEVIQGVLKHTDDIPLIFSELCGLPYLMAVTENPIRAEYLIRENSGAIRGTPGLPCPETRLTRGLYVLDHECTLYRSWSPDQDSLNHLAEKLEI